ncbi:PepSY domain-containing protein [Planococcus liqunii]|uniref:PepSY domain-containing protein n=1 Tax=Planococcus liqunii TaxID=3058394 RepID=A0ABT8MMP7_9BACL|nr:MULTISPECIES: PepSY domain-containing protein [unclassified Planococcus (in: firmicutes)]MDN7226140.1 PepSY domain-containing protein [Planococcus sp. N064]WKA49924.1 PepSY domain-containing protein [Planococcus sp. N056]
MRKWMLMAAGTVLLGIIVIAFLLNPFIGSESISAQEAEQSVLDLYGGELVGTSEVDNHFEVDFNKANGLYTAMVNKATGQVESMKLIEKKEPATRLNEEQAGAAALKKVNGTLENVTYLKDSQQYEVKIKDEKNITTVLVAAATGEIGDITAEPITKPDAKPEPEPEPDAVITEDEAIAIAKQTLDGEVQEIEFVQTEGGGYYLIEIENEESEREVTVQIHAIRGETLTVEWDD